MNMDIRSQGRSHWLNNKAKSSAKPAERRAAQHDNQAESDAFWSSVNLKEGRDSERVVISSIYNSLPRACCIFIWISIRAATHKHNSGAPIKEAMSLYFGTLEELSCVPTALEVGILQVRWRRSQQCFQAALEGPCNNVLFDYISRANVHFGHMWNVCILSLAVISDFFFLH